MLYSNFSPTGTVDSGGEMETALARPAEMSSEWAGITPACVQPASKINKTGRTGEWADGRRRLAGSPIRLIIFDFSQVRYRFHRRDNLLYCHRL